MTHTTEEIVEAIAFLAETLPTSASEFEVIQALAQIIPRATKEDLVKAAAAQAEVARQEAYEFEMLEASVKRDLEMFSGLPTGTTYYEAVSIKASAGDPVAISILEDMNSPRAQADMALLEAAIDAHPAWSRDGEFYLFDDEIGGPDEDVDLIDWFQRTYPREAAAIERKFAGNADVA